MPSLHKHEPTPLAWSSLLHSLPESVRQRVQRNRDIEEFRTTFFDRIDIFLETVLCNGYLHPSDIQLIVKMSEESIERSLPSVEALVEPVSAKLDAVTESLVRYLWSQRDLNNQLEAQLNTKHRTYCDIVQTINYNKMSNTEGPLYYMSQQIATLQQELNSLRLSREALTNITRLDTFVHQVSQFKTVCVEAKAQLKKLFSRIEYLIHTCFSTAAVSTTVDTDN